MLKIAFFVVGLLCSHTLSSVISFGEENDNQIEMDGLETPKKQIRSTTAIPKYKTTRGKPTTPPIVIPKKTTAKTTLIPTSSSSSTETTTTNQPSVSSGCPKPTVYFQGTNNCVDVLLRGPCQKGEWIVVNEKTETGECKDHPEVCEDDAEEKQEDCIKAILKQSRPLDDSLLRNCNNTGMMLTLTRYGTVMCICKPGLVYWKTGHACHEPFKQGPCEDGQYLNMLLKKVDRHPTTEVRSTTTISMVESTTTQKAPTHTETNRHNKITELATKKRKDGDRRDIVFPEAQTPSTEKSTTPLVPRRKPRSPEILFDDEDVTRMTQAYRRSSPVKTVSTPSPRYATKKYKESHSLIFGSTASQRYIHSVTESQLYLHETDNISSSANESPMAKGNSRPSSERPATSTPASTTKPTIRPKVRFIDEMDNTGFSFIGARRFSNVTAGPLTGNTTDKVTEQNTNNLNIETEYEPDLVCTPNPCLNGSFPVDMRTLEKSPNFNISTSNAERGVIFEEVEMETKDQTVICDYIGSEGHCKTGFVLGINVETFQIDCVENVDEDILTRQIMSEVPSTSCGSGQRLDASGKCVTVRRFLG